MYCGETSHGKAVHTANALACGRILVLDDDRVLGGFMLAALESRGHDVDWAGCISDGLASLYAARYDLVIVDLRLPDGSGLDFLREAADEGVLAGTSAIILTGHDDFEEPHDIRVFRKPIDLDPFLDRMADIVAQTRRRRVGNGASHSAGSFSGSAHDSGRGSRAHKIDLVLYVSPSSEKCQKAIRTLHHVLEEYDTTQVRLSIRDLSNGGTNTDEDAVVFTPTLVKRGPGPRTWIVGSLDHKELLVDLLEMSGVRRKR